MIHVFSYLLFIIFQVQIPALSHVDKRTLTPNIFVQSNYIKLDLRTKILNLKIRDEIGRNAKIIDVMSITVWKFYHTLK